MINSKSVSFEVMKDKDYLRVTDFLYELGTMRKILRMHRQVLMTDDLSDNIASHSFRVAMIGFMLAKMEKADPHKVMMMCLIHDFDEIRSGDHNWLHKRYVEIDDEQIDAEQLGTLPYDDLAKAALEYKKRESKEAVIAKDADLLDQVLLLREYSWTGNKEAELWLSGKRRKGSKNTQLKSLKTKSAARIGQEIIKRGPSDWWKYLWTPKNRKVKK